MNLWFCTQFVASIDANCTKVCCASHFLSVAMYSIMQLSVKHVCAPSEHVEIKQVPPFSIYSQENNMAETMVCKGIRPNTIIEVFHILKSL